MKGITGKYLKLVSTNRSVTAMTMIAVTGIALGVAVLILSVTVATSFGQSYKNAITDFSAHVVILSTGEIEDTDREISKLRGIDVITEISPFVYREGLIIHRGQVRGLMLKGLNAESVKSIGGFDADFKDGGIILGKYLAEELDAVDGDSVRLMLPKSIDDKTNFETFTVAGVFESGMYDLDSQFGLLDLKEAQKLFGMEDRVSGIEIKIKNADDAALFARELEDKFTYPLYVSSWQELNRSLFEAVKLEKIMFIIIMGALLIVSSFNVIGTIMLKILYKTPDIAVFRALGMKLSRVKWLFTAQGLFVGLAGTFVGVILSVVIIEIVRRFELLQIPPEIYLVKTLPICISWPTVISVAAFSVVICGLTSKIASHLVGGVNISKGFHRP